MRCVIIAHRINFAPEFQFLHQYIVTMKPKKFTESNCVLERPKEMTEDECGRLPIWTDGDMCISCWGVPFIERIKILLRGQVWLGVKSGNTMPPVFVVGNYPFNRSKMARVGIFLFQTYISIKTKIKSIRGRKSAENNNPESNGTE